MQHWTLSIRSLLAHMFEVCTHCCPCRAVLDDDTVLCYGPWLPDPGSTGGDAQAYQSAAERREELKQHMAVACSQLLAAPEEHVRNLRALLALTADDDVQVRPTSPRAMLH